MTALLVVAVHSAAWARCVWKSVGSQGAHSIVSDWFEQVSASNRDVRWSISSDDKIVSIRLEDGANAAVVRVTLDSSCRRTVQTEWTSGTPRWFDDQAAGRLVDGLGLVSGKIEGGRVPGGQAALDSFSFLGISNTFDFLFLILCIVFAAMAFLSGRDGWRFRAVDALFVAALATLAALPVFNIPFNNDAPILRVVYSARDVFGDWNHPFLAYLLNRPAALLSHDPAILRLTYFLWVVIEMFLFSAIARKISGRGAAALVAIWMAISVRQTMGMIDLSDWNLAGVFLALMVLWVMDHGERGHRWKWIPVPALLILAGYYTSYLMSVPAGLLALFVILETRRGRIPRVHAALTVLAMAVVTYSAIQVFILGEGVTHQMARGEVWQMLRALFIDEPPLGLSFVMPVLVAGGFATCSFRRFGGAWRFCLANLLTAIVAIVISFVFSNVNGAYYFALFKGIGFVSAAALVCAIPDISASMRGADGKRGWVVQRLLPAAVAVALVLLTFDARMPNEQNRDYDEKRMADFAELTVDGALPVVTNVGGGTTLLEYQDALAGRIDYRVIIDPRVRYQLHRKVNEIDRSLCGSMPERFHLLWRNSPNAPDSNAACDPRQSRDCTELFMKSGEEPCENSNRIFCYYDCVIKAPSSSPLTE
ncbi:MAG TPA: hypothetical protein PLZ31_08295 [Myxococcota bacterium]|nr:hypothetical protein [Myxococcota bacterium]HNZ04021.1 hypothetical protein [Myxococcota bacterium]HPB51211.1 hypothetical protein [Myxococcota bacterium]